MSERLQAELDYAVGTFLLQLKMDVLAGTTHVLLGESGAGKSTVLRLLAGVLKPARGRVAVNGTTYLDTGTGINRAPQQRSVGYVFQDGRLFPHLSALENVAFPLRAAGKSAVEARKAAQSWLDRLGIGALGDRLPGRLSGGEAQRVALARALVREPALLLLDEPLASIDVRTRQSMRDLLRGVLGERARITVLVTHDYLDAAVLADQVQVLERGEVVQEGTVGDLVARPRSPYVGQLAGMNVWRGEARMVEGGACQVRVGSRTLRARGEAAGPAFVAVAPAHVTLHPGLPEGSARNVLPGEIRQVVPLAAGARVTVDAGDIRIVAEVTRQSAMELGLKPGLTVFAAFKATETEVYR